ncbi:hypothetical protein BH11MYX3_BH11MYX3_17920 [soil metagenome]
MTAPAVEFTDVPLGTTATTTRIISSDVPDALDEASLNGLDCPRFTAVVSGGLGQTVNGGNKPTITFTFTPTTRTTVMCVLTLGNSGTQNMFVLSGTGIGPAITTVPASTMTFPSLRVANAATLTAALSVRISNSGDPGTNLMVGAASLLGTAGADYTIGAGLPATIPAGAFVDVTITFDPTAPGLRLAQLTIPSDDPAIPSSVISLSGTGTSAVISAQDAAFGTVIGGATGNATINVTNTAAAPQGTLSVFSASIAQTSTWFSFAGNGAGCAGQTTCNFAGATAPAPIAMRCSPPAGASGTQTAMVTFTSDTDAGGDSVAMLTCTAGKPDIMVAPTTLTFADQLAGTTSAAMQIVVTNSGNAPLVYNIAATVGTPAAFPLAPACPMAGCTLAAGLSAMHNVTFSPSAPGPFSTTFNITSNDPDPLDMSIPVMVSGMGITRQISMPATLDFMNVDVGANASLVLTAMNTGSAPLAITSATITAGATDFTVTTGNAGAQSVAAMSSTMWTIRCSPTASGTRSGTFRVVSNSFTNATATVALTCNGQQGVLATTPVTTLAAPLDFGGVTVGNVDTRSFVLRNSGNVAVTGIAAVLAPSTLGYTLDPTTPVPTSLAPGATASINVKFSPMAGTDGGPATIQVTGSWGASQTTMVTVFINGDGLTAGYDVTTLPSTNPPAIDFGSLRWDATATGTFCIVNTEQTPLIIQNPITITPNAPTVAGELSVTAVKRNATCSATGGSAATLPQTLNQNEILLVTVTANPNDRTGLLSATATVTSNLAMNPTRTVALTAMSTTAMLTTTPGLVVDFGSVDRDGPPAMRTITITNTGDAPLNLSSFARNPVTGPFTFTMPTNQAVPIGGHLDVVVTYTPTLEQAPNAFEQVVLSHSIAGVLNGPASQMITIRGRGVDRHIALDASPTFPDTFRNPGAMAPMMPVTVRNTGEATLSISAVMVTNDNVWELLDTAPVDIASMGSHEFMVRFSPKIAGKAPVGELTFMNNDNNTPMAVVLLNGNGLDRNVMMGNPVSPLGVVGIGNTVTIENELSVTSMDPTHGFTIRSITLDDAQNFSIVASPVDVTLPAQTTMTFSVSFTPTAEGVFETKAYLYLDEDPMPQAEVTLSGTAVFVDVTGGGGCSTGGGTGTGAIILIGVLALRRRRRAAAVVLAAVAALFVPAAVRADGDLDLSLFNPTPATTGNGFQVQPASVGDNGTFAAAATVSYATNPLVLKFSGSEHMSITQRTTMELGAAYAFLGRFEAGVRMPLYNQAGDGAMVGVASPSGTARGDLVLHGKVQLAKLRSPGAQLFAAATLALTLPTATGQEFAGVDNPTGRVLGLVTVIPRAMASRLSLTANVGAVIRQTSTLSNIEQGSGLAWGLGGSVHVLDQLWATGEVFGEVMPSGRAASAMSSKSTLAPTEALFGLTYRLDSRFSIGLAVGRGVIAGLGTPDLRGVFALSFVPGSSAPPPLHPPPPPKIEGDADGDGLLDSVDRCPQEAEDKDMFDDTDGCPDLDNDEDGVADAQDKCPLDAEDKDGFQDDDGCPDKDNDSDGVVDAQDKCPDQAEDKDGYQDIDGCPDPDNDGDGILDGQDMCPNEPETINGNQDDDGCPDRGDALVVVTPAGIETIEAVQFTGTRIAKASTNVLGQVAATLRAHPEIIRLKIVAHVQPTGDAAKDQDVSDKRAQAVRDWFTQAGIAASRISAMGSGGSKPLVPRTAKNAQLINDRVDMIILERK